MLAASTAVESRCVTIRRRSQPQQTRPAIAVRAILGPVAAGRGPSPAAALQSGCGPAEPAAARQNPLRRSPLWQRRARRGTAAPPSTQQPCAGGVASPGPTLGASPHWDRRSGRRLTGHQRSLECARRRSSDLLHQHTPASGTLLCLRGDATAATGAVGSEHACHPLLTCAPHTTVTRLCSQDTHCCPSTTPRRSQIGTHHVEPLLLRHQATRVNLTQALGFAPILMPATLTQGMDLVGEASLSVPNGQGSCSKRTPPQRPVRRRL